jgi:Tfp pilus assembly protein PilN
MGKLRAERQKAYREANFAYKERERARAKNNYHKCKSMSTKKKELAQKLARVHKYQQKRKQEKVKISAEHLT